MRHSQPCAGRRAQVYWLLMGVVIVMGATSSVGSMGVRIAVENKAVKAMFGDQPEALSATNAGGCARGRACVHVRACVRMRVFVSVFHWLCPVRLARALEGRPRGAAVCVPVASPCCLQQQCFFNSLLPKTKCLDQPQASGPWTSRACSPRRCWWAAS